MSEQESFDVGALTALIPPVLVKQPDGSQKEHKVEKMDFAATRLYKRMVNPGPTDDEAELVIQLFKRIMPTVTYQELELMTPAEIVLYVAVSMGLINKVMAEWSKEIALAMTEPTA